MAFKKKTWIDRMVEFAGRRKITNVSTSAAQIIDVERAEGAVSQEGDAFSAENMNDLEKRISDAFADVPSGYKIADNDTTNNSEFLATARVAYEHGLEIDALSRDLGGCSLEQDGVDFYIVGADAVRKKLNETPEYSVLDCGGVDFKEHEFGQWHHGYHFTKVSEIPNFGSMVHGKDFFIEVYNGGTNQLNAGIGVSYVKHSNSELVMTSVNGLKGLYVKVYYINNRAIPAPSSFLKSIDFTIASGTATKNILLADIPDAGEIVCAGLVSRGWEGWNALNVTYTAESVTITFSTSGHNGSAFGSEVVRVWYR